MRDTPSLSIILFLIASLLGAVGQYLYKSGADAADDHWAGYLTNWRLLLGVLCYVGVMILFVAAFRIGGQLQVLYPIYATTFIWAAIIAWMAYGNAIRPLNVVGMCLLVLGMYWMGK